LGVISCPKPLNDKHDTSLFDCGNKTLTEWLNKKALKNQGTGASRTFVVCEKRRLVSFDKETELLALLNSLVKEAEDAGDLDVLKSRSIEAVTFCNWSMSFGTLALMMRAEEAQVVKKLDMQEALLHNICVSLDGLGWKPLSSDWDYRNSIKRIREEVFAKEMEILEQQNN